MLLKDYIGKKISFPNTNIVVKPQKRINHSNNSQVYICCDDNSNKYILKILIADSEDKLTTASINTEIIILSYLKGNPNIVFLIDYYFQETSSESSYYILLEYCKNNLSDIMDKLSIQKNCFSDNQLWKLLYDISKALKALHSFRYIHRDLRPENILINDEGTYKICDFAKSTNKIYESNNNSNRNEIILDISKFTTPSIRAPEQIDLFSGNTINEKVDMWAIGLLLYSLLFDTQNSDSNKILQIKGEIYLSDEMINNTNPAFITLIKMLLSVKPKNRISAEDLLVYIEKNWEKNEDFFFLQRKFSLINKISETTAKIFKRHSTQFWVLKLTDQNLEPPKIKYIKCLLNKAWTKKIKINKFFENVSKLHVNYLSSVALKSLFAINCYILFGPPEVLKVSFNIQDFIASFANLWKQRFETNNYDDDDKLKNSNISKFICSYSDYIMKKIKFHKNYSFIENNFSLENVILNKHFDYLLLTDRFFIKDLFTLFSYLYQIYSKVPIVVVHASRILDQIVQIMNDELCFIFILCLYLIVLYKHFVFLQSEDQSREFDSCFIELVEKVNELTEKHRKFRFEIKSKLNLILLPSNLSDYLRHLNNNLKIGISYLKKFSIKNFLITTKDINGIKMHPCYGSINQEINRSLFTDDNTEVDFMNFSAIREQINKHFDLSHFEKFNFFRYNDNTEKVNEMIDTNKNFSPIINKTKSMNKGIKPTNQNISFQNNSPKVNKNIIFNYNSNTNISVNRNFSNENILDDTLKDQKINCDIINNNNDFANVLNEIFESTSKNQRKTSQISNNAETNEIHLPKYDSEKLKNILNEMDKLYKNIEDTGKENNYDKAESKLKPSLPSFSNNFNNIFIDNINDKKIIDNKDNKEVINIIKSTVDYGDVYSSRKEPNINNIENNINSNKVENYINLEDIANTFLHQELSKSSLHWLISSKDIKIEKQIGFGGSSEVYQANYRGTEVAVKKLRILEVKEENLKEFKREVSSLIMLRHPNLVLFMGAIAEKDNICIVTEYCAGGTLFSVLHQRKDLIIPWELRLKILYEIAVGINFLHTNTPPIIHRDLKSLNILLTEKIEKPSDTTKIKISDFGLSKIIKHLDNEKDKMTGQLGTCHWMAPEVIDNKDYTLKADVYSFGIIIWEICCRKTPYADMNQQQISYLVSIKKGRPDHNLLPPNSPKHLIRLMEFCWDEDANKRPSFSQIIDILKKLMV